MRGEISDVVLEKDGKIIWIDCVKNDEVLRRVEKERNIIHTIKKKEG